MSIMDEEITLSAAEEDWSDVSECSVGGPSTIPSRSKYLGVATQKAFQLAADQREIRAIRRIFAPNIAI